MKTKAFLFVLPLAAALAFSCTRDILAPDTDPAAAADPSGLLVPFTAEAGSPQTKVAMKDGSTSNIVFSEGDQLMVFFYQLVEPSILTLKSGAGNPSAVFTGDLILKSGKTEADLAGKTLQAILIPAAGVEEGVFTYDPSAKKLTVDYSTKAVDSDLEALVSRCILYWGETKYEDRKFNFEMLSSFVKMNVTVPKEESGLAREYTVTVQPNIMISNKVENTGSSSWYYSDYCACPMAGTFTASSATSGTLYMALLAGRDLRLEIDDFTTDEPTFEITMENTYKGYGLQGGSISGQVILPGKGYTKAITLTDYNNEDVLLGQPESVRNRIMSIYHGDKNSNGYLSKYEAAQLTSVKMYGNEDLTDASFYQYFTGMTVFEAETLINCRNMTKVLLPKYITEVGERAFEGCTKLSTIIIPSGVTSIGDYAFNNSTSLSRIVIPSGVVTIGDCAFRYCTSMTEVVFDTPAMLTSIGEAAFENSTSLEAIAIPSKVTAIKDKTFNGCTSLSNVSIPVSVTSIGENAFSGCTALTSVSVPARVTSIGANAFARANKLKTVTLPTSGLKAIAEGTFSNCSSLLNIALPSDVETIGPAAFKECSSLVNITIPASVGSIGYEAFYNCESLTSVYLYPLEPPVIVYYTFYGCPNATFYVVDKDPYWDAHATWSQWYWSRIEEM